MILILLESIEGFNSEWSSDSKTLIKNLVTKRAGCYKLVQSQIQEQHEFENKRNSKLKTQFKNYTSCLTFPNLVWYSVRALKSRLI